MHESSKLVLVKLLHTIVWAFFAGAVVLIPVLAYFGQFRIVTVLVVLVLGETLVLLLNQWRCPLTDLAGRYTQQRQANHDIYLPLWLARHNQLIFGTLFVLGLLYAGLRFARLL